MHMPIDNKSERDEGIELRTPSLLNYIRGLYEEKTLWDVELEIFDEASTKFLKSYHLHRVVLARCTYFNNMFSRDKRAGDNVYSTSCYQEAKRIKIKLFLILDDWISEETLDFFFSLFYEDDFAKDTLSNRIEKSCLEIHFLASFVDFSDLVNYCEDLLASAMTDKNMRSIIHYCMQYVPTTNTLYKSCMQWLKAFFFYLHMDEESIVDKLSPFMLERLIKDEDVLWWSEQRHMLIKGLLKKQTDTSSGGSNRNETELGNDDDMEGCHSPIICIDIDCENPPSPSYTTLLKLKDFHDKKKVEEDYKGERVVFFLDRQYYNNTRNGNVEKEKRSAPAPSNFCKCIIEDQSKEQLKARHVSLMTTFFRKRSHNQSETWSIFLIRGVHHECKKNVAWLALTVRDSPKKRSKHSKAPTISMNHRTWLYHLRITVHAIGNRQTFTSEQRGVITTNYNRLDLKNSVPKDWLDNCFTFSEDSLQQTCSKATLLHCGDETHPEGMGYYSRSIMPFVVKIKVIKKEEVF